jgi:hypothetical protein
MSLARYIFEVRPWQLTSFIYNRFAEISRLRLIFRWMKKVAKTIFHYFTDPLATKKLLFINRYACCVSLLRIDKPVTTVFNIFFFKLLVYFGSLLLAIYN